MTPKERATRASVAACDSQIEASVARSGRGSAAISASTSGSARRVTAPW